MREGEIAVDLFAGGGGASQGYKLAIGKDPDVAVNHDPIAIAMHEANHPGTWHLRQDVWQVPPKWATKGRPVGLLWASPDCTHHSKAKGGAPTRDERKRDLAWVIEKWAQAVRPRVIFLENVQEFKDWGPLDKQGHIIKSQKGTTFTAFVRSFRKLGYRVQWRTSVACDHGAPTSRERLFMIMRCDEMPIVWPEPTHGPGRNKPWRTAAEIIDWSIPCPSIFERKKPLAENTLRRIANGIRKYVLENPEPFIVTYYGMKNTAEFRGCGLGDPIPTQTSANRHALVVPYLYPRYGERQGQVPRTHSVMAPLPTIVPTANGAQLVSAFLAKHYSGVTGQPLDRSIGTITSIDHHSLVACNLIRHFGRSTGRSLSDPVGTIMPGGSGKTGLVASYLVKYKGTSKHGQSLKDPLHTVQCNPHYAQVSAFLMKYYSGGGQLSGMKDPLATVTTRDRMGLVTVIVDGEPHAIVDIGMRMLSPRELFCAQGFDDSYIIDIEINGKRISKEAQVAMCGNSVSPPHAAALIRANMLGVPCESRYDGTQYLQLNMFAKKPAKAGAR